MVKLAKPNWKINAKEKKTARTKCYQLYAASVIKTGFTFNAWICLVDLV